MISFETFYKSVIDSIANKERLRKAFDYGKNKHDGQFRKGNGDPYFIHPIRVAQLLADYPEDMIISGLLHDVVEDTDTSISQIEQIFGHTVAKYVDGMTKRDTENWDVTLERIAATNPEVLLIKIADRFDNLTDNFNTMKQSTKDKYRTQVKVFNHFINRYKLQGHLVEKLQARHTSLFGDISQSHT